jgi:hypothetical protein
MEWKELIGENHGIGQSNRRKSFETMELDNLVRENREIGECIGTKSLNWKI